jgi:predicted phosphodiesterase
MLPCKKLYKPVIIIPLAFMIVCLVFTSALADNQKIKFAVISDHKKDFEGLDTALEFVFSQQVDFLIAVGDFSPLAEAYPYYYASWGFEVRADVLPENQNLYFVMGNHDAPPSGDAFFRLNIAPYFPNNGPFGAPQGTIFSFDVENTHLVFTNQYHGYAAGGYTAEQRNWIDADLNASRQPFKFVFGHEPAFPLDRHVGDSLDIDPVMRDAFWAVLADNDVQAYFCGHTHHLSVVKSKGVYQIDTGEATSSHLSIALVEIDSDIAVVRLYETKGSIPETSGEDNVFNSNLNGHSSGDEAYTIVFNSDISSDNDPWWGCFLETLRF